MVNKKIITIIASVLILFIIIFSYSIYLKSPRTEQTESAEICNTLIFVDMFVKGENLYSVSEKCNALFAEDVCRLIFNNFLLYGIKNNKEYAFDANSSLNKIFFSYLRRYQPEISENEFAAMLNNFRSQTITPYHGLNAFITKNESYCNSYNSTEEIVICRDTVAWLNAKNASVCEDIGTYNVKFLCLYDLSSQGYLSQVAECKI